MGTSDVVAYALAHGKDLSGTTLFSFSYNGDDALELRLSGLVMIDWVFAAPIQVFFGRDRAFKLPTRTLR